MVEESSEALKTLIAAKLKHVQRFSRADLEFLEDNQEMMRAVIREARQHDIDVTLKIEKKEVSKLTITRTYVPQTNY